MRVLKVYMEEYKIYNLIEMFEDVFNEKLQYARQKFNLGITERTAKFKYNDVEFSIRELSSMSMMTGERINRIMIEIPKDIFEAGGIQVCWNEAYTMTDAINIRKKACHNLAHEFVTEVLPKVDYEISKAIYNKNIDRILSVLD